MHHRLASRFIFAALVTGLLATGCSKRDASSAPTSAPAIAAQVGAAPGAGSSPGTGSDALAPAGRAMRITTDTNVVVTDMDAALDALRREVQANGGYVSEAHVSGSTSESRSASLEVRVPTTKLGGFRASVAKLGEVTSDTEKAEDVTEQRADVNARLSNARSEEKRLLDLLAARTGSLADVMAVEKEIANVRENIERMEAQQRLLEGQISFATSKIELHTQDREVAAAGPMTRIGRAAVSGVEAAGTFLVSLGIGIAASAPTLMILALMGYGVFRVIRFLARRNRRPAPVAS